MRSIANLSAAGFAVLLLAGIAAAGPLPTDPNAIPGWQGSKVLTSAKITATVEYAVYAPGDFDTSLALDTPVDPSLDSDYVYAYEVFAGALPVKDLTVQTTLGAIPMSYVGTNHIDHYSFNPELGTAPNNWFFNTGTNPTRVTNAKWTSSLGIPSGGHSDILFFTSPFPPQFLTSSISGGGTNIATSTLPSPIPEPTTAALSVIAAVCLFAARRLRARKA